MKGSIPQPKLLSQTEPQVLQTNGLKDSIYSTFLLKRYATNIMLVSKGMDILYAGETALKIFDLQRSDNNLEHVKNEKFHLILEEAFQTVTDQKVACIYNDVVLRETTVLTKIDLLVAPINSSQDSSTTFIIEVLESRVFNAERSSDTLAAIKLKELQQQNNFLDAFVHGAAHDLNGGLVVLKSFMQMFNRFKSEERKNKALQSMKKASNRMEKILKGLAELIAHQRKPRSKVALCQFETLFDYAKMHLEVQIEKAQPTFNVSFQEAKEIQFYKTYLNSILYNLLSNAIKYRKEDEPLNIEIETYPFKEWTVLRVKDNGIGMDLEACSERLFQPFNRFCTEREGIGLGLSFINKLVTEEGGYIEVDSEPGRGTEFKVYLRPTIFE